MEKKRFLCRSAVMVIIEREQLGRRQVLLQKRLNTGYMDGMWDMAATGHVEANESMTMAAAREAGEELGIVVRPEDLRFATITHKYTPKTGTIYYNGFFAASRFEGTPTVNEPDKCAGLAWFDMDRLPDTLIPDRAQALANYLAGVPYDETGWDAIPGPVSESIDGRPAGV